MHDLRTLARYLDTGETTASKLIEAALERTHASNRYSSPSTRDWCDSAIRSTAHAKRSQAVPPLAGIRSRSRIYSTSAMKNLCRLGSAQALCPGRIRGCTGGRAAARSRTTVFWAHQYERICFFRHRQECALRHAAVDLGPSDREIARRFIVRQRGCRRRRHRTGRAGFRYRRILPYSGGFQRHRRRQTQSWTHVARRNLSLVADTRRSWTDGGPMSTVVSSSIN